MCIRVLTMVVILAAAGAMLTSCAHSIARRERCEALVLELRIETAREKRECRKAVRQYDDCRAARNSGALLACGAGAAVVLLSGGAALPAAASCLSGGARASAAKPCAAPSCAATFDEIQTRVLADYGLSRMPVCERK